MTTHRTIGLPGTGKTTKMIKEIDKLLKEDVNIQDIAMTTFSRRMADKLSLEISHRYELDYEDLYNVGTIHGLCRRQLNVDIKRLSDNPKNSPHIRALFHEFQDFSEKI